MKQKVLLFTLLFISLLSCSKNNIESDEKIVVEPSVTARVEVADIEAYFAFDKAQTIGVALKLIQSLGVEKTVNAKKVTVSKTTVVSTDDRNGTFKLRVEGMINGKAFAQDFEFVGFAKAVVLTDYEIGSRAYAQWKVTPDIYLKDFDLDKLIVAKDKNFFTVDYLKSFVDFYASSVSGQQRLLTADEVNNLKIKDIAYSYDNQIVFRTEYKLVVSNVMSRLSFDKEKYYSQKVSLNTNFISARYMRGCFDKLGEFFQGFLDYDRTRYVAELDTESSEDNHANTISLNIRFLNLSNGELLTNIHRTVTGFKALSDLKKELTIASTSDLEDYMKKKALIGKTSQQITTILQATIATWSKKLQYGILRNGGAYSLSWDDSNTVLLGNGGAKDVYLQRPSFEILSSEIANDVLNLKIRLSGVNGEVLSDITFDISVRNIK